MTGEQLIQLIAEAISGDDWANRGPDGDADAVLRAIRAAGLVVCEPAEVVAIESDRQMFRFTNPVVLDQIAECGLELVRVVD